MIISRKHRFIFLHNPKTAGSSVTVSLSRYLGPWDIQSGMFLSSMEEGIFPNFYSYARVLHPRVKCGLWFLRLFLSYFLKHGYPAQKAFGRSFDAAVKSSWKKVWSKKTLSPTHPGLEDVRIRFRKEWENYLKFCVVRNPWDQVVSYYHYKMHISTHFKLNKPSFSEWFQENFQNEPYRFRKLLDASLYCRIDGQLAVDYVVKYENLQNDLSLVCNKIGLDWDGWLPNKKGAIRPNRDYRGYYDKTMRRCIAEAYQQDIEEFGYEW